MMVRCANIMTFGYPLTPILLSLWRFEPHRACELQAYLQHLLTNLLFY